MQREATTSEPQLNAGSLAALLRSASQGSKMLEAITKQAEATCKPMRVKLQELTSEIEKVTLPVATDAQSAEITADLKPEDQVMLICDQDEALVVCMAFGASELSILINDVFGAVHVETEASPPGVAQEVVAKCLGEVLLSELVNRICVPGAITQSMVRRILPGDEAGAAVPAAHGVLLRIALQSERQTIEFAVFVSGHVCADADGASGQAAGAASGMALLKEIKQTEVNLNVVLETVQMSLGEIARLRSGSLLELDLCLGHKVQVDCGEVRLLTGILDQRSGCFCVTIGEFLDQDVGGLP